MSPPLPPPVAGLARPVGGNPGAWFGPGAYPEAALCRWAQGRVEARLAVAADGRVVGCTLVTTSGDGDLDRATCATALRGRRLVPARAADGRPVAGSYALKVRWALPEDAPAARASASAALPRPSPPANRHHADWPERILLAHDLLGAAAVLFAGGLAWARRRLFGSGDGRAEPWLDRDHLPVRRRRRVPAMVVRLALLLAPPAALAAAFAWLGW